MKNKLFLTISLCAAIASTACVPLAAHADGSAAETLYPETFAASEITDYAVNGETYAFAADKKISVFTNNGKPVYYEFSAAVTALDCADGVFYYKLSGSEIYSLPDKQVTSHKMSVTTLPVSESGYSYSLNEGNINIWDGVNTAKVEGNFSNVKVFENVVYAVNGNRLNKITPPASAEVIPFEIADFEATERIPVGGTLSALKTYNLEKPHFATLKDGEYLTEVYLNELTTASEYFIVGNTVKVGESEKFIAGQTALILCKTGNADIIALNGACYIKLADEGAAFRELTSPEYENATVCVPFDYAYSSPFVNESTRLFEIDWGEEVTVLGKISSPELKQEFYLVSRAKAGGGEETGYVPCGFLVESDGGEKESETKDPDYSESDMIRTVVLVILLVVLILCATCYIVYVLTAGKKKSVKTNRNEDNENQ